MCILGPEDKSFAEKQWVWLEEQLKYSQDDYLLVGGHFPVWSIAEHGPTDCLVDRLKPLLEKYKASSYICGHDHNLQVDGFFVTLDNFGASLNAPPPSPQKENK